MGLPSNFYKAQDYMGFENGTTPCQWKLSRADYVLISQGRRDAK